MNPQDNLGSGGQPAQPYGLKQPAEGNTTPYMNQQGAGYTGMQYRFDGSSPQN